MTNSAIPCIFAPKNALLYSILVSMFRGLKELKERFTKIVQFHTIVNRVVETDQSILT